MSTVTKSDPPKVAPAESLQRPDPIAELLASLTPLDPNVFVSPGRPAKIDLYTPVLKRSIEGKNADGIGAAYQLPCTYGESAGVARQMRRSGRNLGVAVQVKWIPADPAEFSRLVSQLRAAVGQSDAHSLSRLARDDAPGALGFRTAPRVVRRPNVDVAQPRGTSLVQA